MLKIIIPIAVIAVIAVAAIALTKMAPDEYKTSPPKKKWSKNRFERANQARDALEELGMFDVPDKKDDDNN